MISHYPESLKPKQTWAPTDEQLFIHTEKAEYFPGEIINGIVYLNLKKNFGPGCLKIQFKGHEHGLRAKMYLAGINPYYEFFPSKAKLQTNETNLYTWNENSQSKQYSFPFSLKLDTILPGSCFLKAWEIFGEISYYIQAKLILNDINQLNQKCNHEILIRQLPMSSLPNPIPMNHETIKSVTLEKESITLKVEIHKTNYLPGEIVHLEVYIDNRKSKLKCKTITIAIKQDLELKAGVDTLRRYILAKKEYLGVDAGLEKQGHMSIEIPNGEMTTYHDLKKSKISIENLKKLIMHEERAPLKISPTTYGVIMKTTFFIDINIKTSGFISKSLNLRFPIHIEAPKRENIKREIKNENWNPIIMKRIEMSNIEKTKSGLIIANSPIKSANEIDEEQALCLENIEFEKITNERCDKDIEKQNLLFFEEIDIDEIELQETDSMASQKLEIVWLINYEIHAK